MANLTLNLRQLGELKQILLTAFPRMEHFENFCQSYLNYSVAHVKKEDYTQTLSSVLEDLQTNSRLRELVRKAKIARRGNDQLVQFANQFLPPQEEGLVMILEEVQLPWDTALANAEPLLQEIPSEWREPFPHEEEVAAFLYAKRAGDLVDALQQAPLDQSGSYPILRFAAAILNSDPPPEIAADLRSWMQQAARTRKVRLPEFNLRYLPVDEEAVAQLAVQLSESQLVVEKRAVAVTGSGQWAEILADAQSHVGRTAVCITLASLAEWMRAGTPSLPQGAAGRVVFPVLLGIERVNVELPSFPPNTWVVVPQANKSPNVADLFRSRLQSLGPKMEAASASPTTTPLVDDAARTLAKWLLNDEVVFVVGPAASWPPSHYSVSRDLLRKLGVIIGEDAWVPPVDLVAMYYAIRNTDPELETEVKVALAQMSALPSTHAELAHLLKVLAARRPVSATQQLVNRRPLIVTTSLDLMIERALLSAEIPFTRVVHHRTGIEKVVDEGHRKYTERFHLVMSFHPKEDDMARRLPAFSDRSHSWNAVDEVLSAARATEANPSNISLAGDNRHPIVYKYHGSRDVDGSCAISAEHMDDFDFNAVPPVIATRLSTKPLLLLGYYWTDPHMRHLRRTLFRTIANNGVDRYAVQYPIPGAPDSVLYQMEKALALRLMQRWNQLYTNPLESDGVVLLSEIIRRLEDSDRLQVPA